MNRCSGSPGDAGFTLLEVVVALTLLSMILLATVTGIRTLANTQESLERMTLRADEVRSVSVFLRDHFEMAQASAGQGGGLTLGGGVTERAFFEGSANSVVWKAPVLFGEGYGGVHLLKVAREENRVVLRWQRQEESMRRIKWNGTAMRALVEEVEEFSVAFRDGINDPWVSNWEQKANPGFLRMRIRARDRVWPDLIVQVQQ